MRTGVRILAGGLAMILTIGPMPSVREDHRRIRDLSKYLPG